MGAEDCSVFDTIGLGSAWVELGSDFKGSTKLGGPIVGLGSACAEVWVHFVHSFLDILIEAELEGSEVDGGDEHPDVEESRNEGASDGVQTFNHVNAKRLSSGGETDLDKESSGINDLVGKSLEACNRHLNFLALARWNDYRSAVHLMFLLFKL